MSTRWVVSFGLLLAFSHASASMNDYFRLDEAQTKVVNSQFDLEADVFFAHRDVRSTKGAPVIRLTVYTAEEDGAEKIGSFGRFADSVRGRSEKYRLLAAQFWIESMHDLQAMRIVDIAVFEESSAIMSEFDYIDGDEVFQQFQMIRWSADGKSQCTVVADESESVAASYRDSITGAMKELIKTCGAAMNDSGGRVRGGSQ